MSFARHTDRGGQLWLVDMDGVEHLIRSYVRSKAVLKRSYTVQQPQDMGPLGFIPLFKLTLVTVQTDYKGLGNQIDKESEPLLKNFKRQLVSSGKNAFDSLVGLRNETIQYNESFRKMQVDASNQTNDAISRALKNSATAEKWTRYIRDTSGSVLMAGAAILSAGPALAVVGTASVLKGGFTFEDEKLEGASTSNAVGAAGLALSSNLAVGVINIGVGKAGKAATAVLVLIGASIDGMTEFAKATIDGKTIRQGITTALTRAGLDTAVGTLVPALGVENLSFAATVTRRVGAKLAMDTTVANLSDAAVNSADKDKSQNNDSAIWHKSLTCTFAPLGDSDVVYVEQHAIKHGHR